MSDIIFDPFLTSQLAVCHLITGDDAWKEEFTRRLKLCGVEEDAVIEALLQYNKDVYTKSENHDLESEEYVRKCYFNLRNRVYDRPFEDLVEDDLLTPSEVIKLFDEAEWTFQNKYRDKECPNDVWEEIYRSTRFYPKNEGAKFLIACTEKLLGLGMSKLSAQNLISNDQLILNIYRWHCKFDHPYAPPREDASGKKQGLIARLLSKLV